MNRQPDTEKSSPLEGGDYASGWWGEEQAKKGNPPPGPYGQPPETAPDAPDLKKQPRPPK